ncbi:DUF4177 domain-containing protein [Paenibacillus xylaniclasticus]|uniref:DUF4177 domain-containing protein n=1 Tax=Paenibacillus xylaniclasticus TaxID=588083 RepID=UPI000FD7673D|nr:MULTISPECIES: DUF4177 domain-containing protein [Paenibacillus]GFN33564.1 hypothetical protein PCURB6_38240 [Paenibacillus curdlanolyticus]
MYKYDIVTIPMSPLKGTPKEDYRKVIDRYAAADWKLHSIVPMPSLAGGQMSALELIFE